MLKTLRIPNTTQALYPLTSIRFDSPSTLRHRGGKEREGMKEVQDKFLSNSLPGRFFCKWLDLYTGYTWSGQWPLAHLSSYLAFPFFSFSFIFRDLMIILFFLSTTEEQPFFSFCLSSPPFVLFFCSFKDFFFFYRLSYICI